MFDLSPGKLLVLAIVGVIVLGPDKLPNLARDAARMIRTLREVAIGAREQLHDELGPEFAEVDLRTLNPRTMIQRAVFGDEVDLSKADPRTVLREAILGDADLRAADPRAALREDMDSPPSVSVSKKSSRPKPGPGRPGAAATHPYDSDAT